MHSGVGHALELMEFWRVSNIEDLDQFKCLIVLINISITEKIQSWESFQITPRIGSIANQAFAKINIPLTIKSSV